MQLAPCYNIIRNAHGLDRTPKKQYTDAFKVKLIIDVLCKYSNYKRDLLLSEAKFTELAELRQIGMAIARGNTKLSLMAIGSKFKRSCHTTVKHSVQVVGDRCDIEKGFKLKVREIQTMIEKYFVLEQKF